MFLLQFSSMRVRVKCAGSELGAKVVMVAPVPSVSGPQV